MTTRTEDQKPSDVLAHWTRTHSGGYVAHVIEWADGRVSAWLEQQGSAINTVVDLRDVSVAKIATDHMLVKESTTHHCGSGCGEWEETGSTD